MNHESDDAFAKRKLAEQLSTQGIHYFNQSRYDKAAEIFEAALKIAREIGDRNGEAAMIRNLGSAKLKLAEQLSNQGIHYRNQSRYDKAVEMFEAALDIAQEIGNRNGEGAMLESLGIVYINIRKFDQAAEKYEAALCIVREIGDTNREGRMLGNLGSIYFDLQQYDQAAEKFQAALNISREIGDRKLEGTWIGNLGNVYTKLGKYEKAAEKYEAALVIAREIGNTRREGSQLSCLGNVYTNLRRYEKAAEKYEEALVITREIGDRKLEGSQLGSLGNVYTNLRRYEKAAEKYEAALVITREIGDTRQEGSQLGSLGNFYTNLRRYEKAAEKYEAALVITREIGDRKLEGSQLGSLGNFYTNLRRYEKAAEKYEAALVITREIGDRKGEGLLVGSLGNVYTDLGKYEKATGKYEAALEIAREIGDRNVEALLVGSLGVVYGHLGQYKEAAEKYEEALMITREIGDRDGEGKWVGNLGNVYIHFGEYDKAAEKLEAASEISQEAADRKGEGMWVGALGNVYSNLGQYEKAAEKYEAALVIAREIGDREGEGLLVGSLGNVYTDLGKYEKATGKYEAALEIARETGDRNREGNWVGNLGLVYKNLGQYKKAAEQYEAALVIAREIGDRNQEGFWLGITGLLHHDLGHYEKAADNHEAALAIAREIGDRNQEGTRLGNLGVCHYVQSNNPQNRIKALENLKESIHVFDDLWMDIKEDDQKITFDDVNGSSSRFAKVLHSLYWNVGHFKDALVTREEASSKSLELLLLESRKDTDNIEYSAKQKKSVTNFEQMRHIAIQSKSAIIVYALHADRDILIWVIKSRDGEDTSLYHEKVPIKKEYKSLQYLVESTRRSLGARDRKHLTERSNKVRELSSLATPMVGEDKHTIDDFNDSDLQAVENELRKSQDEPIADESEIMMKNALRALYDLLILPIESALVDEQQLTIIPFGDLFALPFAALVDRNGTHLIEKHVLSFAPSIGTLVELQHNQDIPKDTKRSTVIVGTGARLSGARDEAKIVHNIVTIGNGQEREVRKFIGKEATKEVVVDAMQSADIIHLATHGSKDGISLSGSTGEDVKLTMGEVQGLNLKGTKMVVLSACDTFKGDLRTDGVVGITRSFLAAGSSTVIASLWPVNDYSTKEMMVRLYRYLFQQKDSDANDGDDDKGSGDDDTVDVSYALQQVMVGMLKEKRGSFDIKQWAPFLVYGLNTSVGN